MDHETYTGRGLQTARQLWTDTKTGVLAQIPIGVGAFVRLDERLKDSPLWNDAPREEGLNPMGLTPNQPTTELLTVEYYLDPRPDAVHPTAAEFTTNIVTMLFSPRSKGFVTLKSKDPLENPAVDHRFLEDPLDLLVMSEACQFANEVMVMGEGTRDIVVGSWPPAKSHHLNTCREDWVPYVKERATTCKLGGLAARVRMNAD